MNTTRTDMFANLEKLFLTLNTDFLIIWFDEIQC